MSKNINQIYVANPITSLRSTDLAYFGRSPYGVTDDTAGLIGTLFSLATTKYISDTGNDTTGNGSIATPYLTLTAALASISDASTSKIYTLVDLRSNATEASVAFKPFVNVVSNGTKLTITNASLSSDWSTASGDLLVQGYQLTIGSTLSFDFRALNQSRTYRIILRDFSYVSGNMEFLGATNTTTSAARILLDNFSMSNGNETALSGTLVVSNSIRLFTANNTFLNTVSLSNTSTTTDTTTYLDIADSLITALSASTASGDNNSFITFHATTSQIASSFSATTASNSSVITLTMDPTSFFAPTITGTGVTVNPYAASQGLGVSITPTYFKKTTTTNYADNLINTIQGIDNQLGLFAGTLTGDTTIANSTTIVPPPRTWILHGGNNNVNLPTSPLPGEKHTFINRNASGSFSIQVTNSKTVSGELVTSLSTINTPVATYLSATAAPLFAVSDTTLKGQYISLIADEASNWVLLENFGYTN